MNEELISDRDAITPERLEIIKQRKQMYLGSNDQALLDAPEIKPEIAESWIRSRQMQVDPYHPEPQAWSAEEARKATARLTPLLDAIQPLLFMLREAVDNEYSLDLIGRNGVTFLREGTFVCPPFEDKEQTVIFTESTMGTGAHTLSLQLKRPVQLIGPEHYCVELDNVIATAAPILDEKGEAVACVLLTQPMPKKAWRTDFKKELRHTMWLIISLAAAIDAGLKLIASQDKANFINESLIASNNALKAVLASVSEPILTINRNGVIMSGNAKASAILKLTLDQLGEANLMDFLPAHSGLLAAVNSNAPSNLSENICVGGREGRYDINIRPIPNPNNPELNMAILKLAPADRGTVKSGSPTRFRFEDIIGQSKTIKQAIETGKRFAGTPETILLAGESGTGKELFAQAIHNQYRPNGPFMAVNCAAMPKNLIESELFGYEGGSFTGADRVGRPGKIELANGGTLFLDEIGDMPLEIQAVLLRVLEDKQVTRIGGKQSKGVDFRVIAATNRNLYEMVKDKTFREDLYFRLSVLPINLPPLRSRGNDALLLSRFFIEDYCKRNGFSVPAVSPDAQKLILKYNWPGNVRQLQNAVYYAVNTAQNDTIEPHNLPEFILFDNSPEIGGVTAATGDMGSGEPLSIKKLEKAAIDLALLQSHNSIPRAAEMLGMSKATLYRKLKEYNNEQ